MHEKNNNNDKKNNGPGVWPIGVGKTLRRIVEKKICLVTHSDAAVVCGKYQLCAGLQSGAEDAIYAMNELFESKITLDKSSGMC